VTQMNKMNFTRHISRNVPLPKSGLLEEKCYILTIPDITELEGM